MYTEQCTYVCIQYILLFEYLQQCRTNQWPSCLFMYLYRKSKVCKVTLPNRNHLIAFARRVPKEMYSMQISAVNKASGTQLCVIHYTGYTEK